MINFEYTDQDETQDTRKLTTLENETNGESDTTTSIQVTNPFDYLNSVMNFELLEYENISLVKFDSPPPLEETIQPPKKKRAG